MDYIKESNLEATTNSIFKDISKFITELDINDITHSSLSDLNQKVETYKNDGIRRIFDNKNILIDDGNLKVISELSSPSYDSSILKNHILQTLVVNNEYFKYQNSPEVPISPLEHKQHLSSNKLKDDVFDILKNYNENLLNIKNNDSPLIATMKESMIVDNYESTCNKLTSKFFQYGMDIDYKETKDLVKISKNLETYNMLSTVQINNFINIKIDDQIKKDIDQKYNNTPSKKNGIFIA